MDQKCDFYNLLSLSVGGVGWIMIHLRKGKVLFQKMYGLLSYV